MNRRFVPPARDLPWPIAYEGVVFIAEFEQGPDGGFGEEAYRCSAGVWTIGWGETDEDKAIPGTTCTKEQADRWLCDDLTARAHKVRSLCKVKPGPHELAAMVSITYNIGLAAFETSSILKAHNRGDALAAARAYDLWNKARNPVTKKLEVLAGLTRRRKGEGAMHLKDSPSARVGEMPQAVAAESKLIESPLAKIGATVAGGGGLISTTAEPTAPAAGTVEQVTQTAQQANEVAGVLTTAVGSVRGLVDGVAGMFGLAPTTLAGVALVLAGAAVVYWRWKQRREGWA